MKNLNARLKKRDVKKFQVGKHSVQSFKYVSLNIVQHNENVTLNQIDYISSIQSIQVSCDLQMCKQQICENEKSTDYRQLIGKPNWIANQSGPDINFDVCHLSSKMKSPTIGDLINTNKVLHKIKENPMTMNFPSLGNLHNAVLKCYNDASLANLPSGNSTGGHVIFLVGEND